MYTLASLYFSQGVDIYSMHILAPIYFHLLYYHTLAAVIDDRVLTTLLLYKRSGTSSPTGMAVCLDYGSIFCGHWELAYHSTDYMDIHTTLCMAHWFTTSPIVNWNRVNASYHVATMSVFIIPSDTKLHLVHKVMYLATTGRLYCLLHDKDSIGTVISDSLFFFHYCFSTSRFCCYVWEDCCRHANKMYWGSDKMASKNLSARYTEIMDKT